MDGNVLKYLKSALTVCSFSWALLAIVPVQAQERQLEEPVYRVSYEADKEDKATRNETDPPAPSVEKLAMVDLAAGSTAIAPATTQPHPLDPALQFAEEKLLQLRENIKDYQAIMIKQERVNGELLPAEYMSIKVRNRRDTENEKTPFSIYMKFLKPNKISGREVIYVEGARDGNLVAHEGGMFNILRVNLNPTGTMAMKGNRYPITDAGIENLVEKLIERGQRDRACGDCDVEFFENAKVVGRSCTMIQVKHDENKAPYDFHIGRIYIDDEFQVPIRYEAYTWPQPGEEELPLLESYTYAKLKINVGLTDEDFNPDNEKYSFP